ncbi:MAG: hypothetical protein V3V10_03810 [Planctomycetota bacterium]
MTITNWTRDSAGHHIQFTLELGLKEQEAYAEIVEGEQIEISFLLPPTSVFERVEEEIGLDAATTAESKIKNWLQECLNILETLDFMGEQVLTKNDLPSLPQPPSFEF